MNNTNTVATVGQETLNNVLIDILRGAKDAGHDIYGASKMGIAKAVDFATEQTPLVVQEFCKWKFAEATINYIGCFLALLVLGWWLRKLLRTFNDASSNGEIFTILVTIVVGILIVVAGVNFVNNVKDSVKISIAPRVYIIDYVTDKMIQSNNPSIR